MPYPDYVDDRLRAEMQDTFRSEEVALEWLERPIPAFEGRTPREEIEAGRSEAVRGLLHSLNMGFTGG